VQLTLHEISVVVSVGKIHHRIIDVVSPASNKSHLIGVKHHIHTSSTSTYLSILADELTFARA